MFGFLIPCNNIKKKTTVKPAQATTSIKQSPVIKGHLFHVLS